MKHKIVPIIAVLAFLLSASPAFAQDVQVDFKANVITPEERARIRAEKQAQIEILKAQKRAEREGIQTQQQEEKNLRVETRFNSTSTNSTSTNATSTNRQQMRIEIQSAVAKRLAANTARLFSATVERLEGILERIESRIERVEENGGDTTRAEAAVEEAKLHIADAKAAIALFVSIELDGESIQENFAEVREMASEVKVHIREIHRSLKDAVVALRASTQVEVESEDDDN